MVNEGSTPLVVKVRLEVPAHWYTKLTARLIELWFSPSFRRLEIDFSSREAILLPGVSICKALFGIEEQYL
jgi:hypothetical protein